MPQKQDRKREYMKQYMRRKREAAREHTIQHTGGNLMSNTMNDLAFAEKLRVLLHLKPDADLTFVSDPHKRAELDGSTPGWLYRAMPPGEKRQIVLDFCNGEPARKIAKRFKRGRGTVVNLLKGVGVYLSPLEKDPKKIEKVRTRISKFLASKEIDQWHASWSAQWRKRKWCAAIAKEGEEDL
jgi:hypothetical protein